MKTLLLRCDCILQYFFVMLITSFHMTVSYLKYVDDYIDRGIYLLM